MYPVYAPRTWTILIQFSATRKAWVFAATPTLWPRRPLERDTSFNELLNIRGDIIWAMKMWRARLKLGLYLLTCGQNHKQVLIGIKVKVSKRRVCPRSVAARADVQRYVDKA